MLLPVTQVLQKRHPCSMIHAHMPTGNVLQNLCMLPPLHVPAWTSLHCRCRCNCCVYKQGYQIYLFISSLIIAWISLDYRHQAPYWGCLYRTTNLTLLHIHRMGPAWSQALASLLWLPAEPSQQTRCPPSRTTWRCWRRLESSFYPSQLVSIFDTGWFCFTSQLPSARDSGCRPSL